MATGENKGITELVVTAHLMRDVIEQMLDNINEEYDLDTLIALMELDPYEDLDETCKFFASDHLEQSDVVADARLHAQGFRIRGILARNGYTEANVKEILERFRYEESVEIMDYLDQADTLEYTMDGLILVGAPPSVQMEINHRLVDYIRS